MKKNSAASVILVILLASAYFAYDSGLLDPFLGQDEPETSNISAENISNTSEPDETETPNLPAEDSGNTTESEETEPPVIPTEESVKVAAFNIQIFGRTKREKPEVMNVLAQIVREFDVVLVQEIRDSSETTAPIFLEAINGLEGSDYAFIRSERLGRTTSKEAYAYFYNTETVEYLSESAFVFDDVDDVFEREPYVASFVSGEFDFTLIGIHT